MNWTSFKRELTSLSPEEKSELELMATIATVRKNKLLTQEQLARRANVSQAQVDRGENFLYAPALTALAKILGGLDLDIALIDRQTGKIARV